MRRGSPAPRPSSIRTRPPAGKPASDAISGREGDRAGPESAGDGGHRLPVDHHLSHETGHLEAREARAHGVEQSADIVVQLLGSDHRCDVLRILETPVVDEPDEAVLLDARVRREEQSDPHVVAAGASTVSEAPGVERREVLEHQPVDPAQPGGRTAARGIPAARPASTGRRPGSASSSWSGRTAPPPPRSPRTGWCPGPATG